MSNALNFINALYAADNSVPVPLDINGERIEVEDGTVISQNDGKLFAYARTSGGLAFVYRVVEDAKPTDYAGCAVVPTAAIYQPDQHLLILIWALDRLTTPEDAAALAEAFGMEDFEDAIPIPPTKGWQTLRFDPNTFTSIETLVQTYSGEIAGEETEEPAAPNGPVETYNDAVVINGPYIPAKYDQVLTLTTGARRDSKKWKPTAITVEVLVNLFTMHKEDPRKDGKAVVLGDMVPGQRLKNAVKALYAIGIDVDNGTPGAKIDAALAELGVLAIRSTTHSHNKTRTEIKKDRLVKWSKTLKLTTAIIRQYLAEAENWDQGLIATVEYVGDDQNERGIVAVLSHAPMPKHRIVVPLASPFVIGKEATTQEEAMKKWGKLPTALAERLGVTLDKACLDPSRLFYLPRHPKGRDFEVKLFVGPLFDWKTLELDSLGDLLDAQLSQGKSKSTTPEGKALGKWWNNRGFSTQIADIIEDHAHDKIRGKASHGWDIECPFDEEHSNAGDPEDRACFAVNSGDGSAEFATVSCRHESCRKRTTLDHIAKMVTDGWFEKDLLEDESYIAESNHDGELASDDQGATLIRKLEKRIDMIPTNNPSVEINSILAVIANIVDPVEKARLLGLMKAKTKIAAGVFKEKLNMMQREGRRTEYGLVQQSDGTYLYRHSGKFDADNAVKSVMKAVEAQNHVGAESDNALDMPKWTCHFDKLVHLEYPKGFATFEECSSGTFWAKTSGFLYFQVITEDGPAQRDFVDGRVADVVYAHAANYLPQTPEIVRAPIVTAKGTLLASSGWFREGDLHDPATYLNVLLELKGLNIPTIPQNPSKAEVAESVALIMHMFSEFAFLDVSKDGVESREASLANAIAMFITPYVRRLIDGCTPLFLITKPLEGAGASYLAYVFMTLFDGKETTSIAPSSSSYGDEEFKKQMVSALLEDRTTMFFDNWRDLNSENLKQALTASVIGGRILGQSHNIERPNNYVWIATGLNTCFGPEIARRICLIGLNTKLPRGKSPKFKRTGLKKWVKKNRSEIIGAFLTLIQSWLANGRVPFTDVSIISFESWAQIVGGILQNAGIRGFLTNPPQISLDSDEEGHAVFVREWYKKFGTDRQALKDLITYALDCIPEVAVGRSDAEKRSNITQALNRMCGATYRVGQQNVIVRRFEEKDGSTTLALVLAGEEGSK